MPPFRQARPSDHPALVACVQSWWGDSRTPAEARELSLLLPRLFLDHFATTSLVREDAGGQVEAFLVGFHAPDGESAYVHFVGVHPDLRGRGVGRELYTAFCDRAAAAGCRHVHAVTSPANAGSIAFHRAMGFELEPGDRIVDGIPVHTDHDGPGHDRVCMRRELAGS